ncbi:Uma2 family endonuclease [Nonomuraea sp. NPDC004580]|uniref:Uma2 family endonuclease n=1 Tax=Nonomuraea sp. NPDC004580 TaxID=3154552 RepID=UPI0033B18815
MATIEPAKHVARTEALSAPFTVDDLLEIPDDGFRYELFNGSLLVSPAPTPRHQRVITRLLLILQTAAPPDLECLTTVNVRENDENCYIPDLVVVPEKVSERVNLMYSPRDLLLAAEVVSPTSRTQDRAVKTAAYAEAGVPVYWRIEPAEGPAVYVYELDGCSYAEPSIHKAGTTVTLSSPFPVSFDPAQLVDLRA